VLDGGPDNLYSSGEGKGETHSMQPLTNYFGL